MLVDALDVFAPVLQFITQQRPTPLYLHQDTLEVMAVKGHAVKSADATYHWLSNQASHLVRRDSHQSPHNFISGSLVNSGNSAAKLWKLVNAVLGRVSSSLPSLLIRPSGFPFWNVRLLADMINTYFIYKILKLSGRFSAPVLGRHLTSSSEPLRYQDDQLSLVSPFSF